MFIRNLHELADGFKHMSVKVFDDHVDHGKNDFYNWIIDVIEDDILGETIKDLKDKDQMAAVVAKRIQELSEVEVDLHIVVIEGVVLLRVEHFEQGRGGVAPEVGVHFVDFVLIPSLDASSHIIKHENERTDSDGNEQ